MAHMLHIDVQQTDALYRFYRSQLLEDCVPFWLKHSPDPRYGGYLTILERDGTPHGFGKYTWTQAREAYMFSKLYNTVDRNEEWLLASRLGVDFLDAYALDEEGRAYYKLSRDGTPLYSRPWQIFAESFICLAWAEYSRAADQEEYLHKAEQLYWRIIERQKNDELGRSEYVHTPLYKEHAPSMILINTTQELREIRDDPRYSEMIRGWVDDELYTFTWDEGRVMLERIAHDGNPLLTEPEGRSVTPGHALESSWFCLREGLRCQDSSIVERSCQIMNWTMELGWDSEYGGIFNFIDCQGRPPGHQDEDWGEDQDWDSKVFWVHSEALYALLLAQRATARQVFADWYQKVHEWSFEHFSDPEFGEWFGYLRRDGSISQTLKGSVKGFFHVPRALLNCMLLLKNEEKNISETGGYV